MSLPVLQINETCPPNRATANAQTARTLKVGVVWNRLDFELLVQLLLRVRLPEATSTRALQGVQGAEKQTPEPGACCEGERIGVYLPDEYNPTNRHPAAERAARSAAAGTAASSVGGPPAGAATTQDGRRREYTESVLRERGPRSHFSAIARILPHFLPRPVHFKLLLL